MAALKRLGTVVYIGAQLMAVFMLVALALRWLARHLG